MILEIVATRLCVDFKAIDETVTKSFSSVLILSSMLLLLPLIKAANWLFERETKVWGVFYRLNLQH